MRGEPVTVRMEPLPWVMSAASVIPSPSSGSSCRSRTTVWTCTITQGQPTAQFNLWIQIMEGYQKLYDVSLVQYFSLQYLRKQYVAYSWPFKVCLSCFRETGLAKESGDLLEQRKLLSVVKKNIEALCRKVNQVNFLWNKDPLYIHYWKISLKLQEKYIAGTCHFDLK